MEETARPTPDALAAARQSLEKDFTGDDPFNQNMRRNLDLFRRHVDLTRRNKPLSREAMQKELLERRFQ